MQQQIVSKRPSGFVATGAILAIPVAGDPGGSSSPERILFVEEYELTSVLDQRPMCPLVLRSQAGAFPGASPGDRSAWMEAPTCPGYDIETCACLVAGYDRPENAGKRLCAFHVAHDDPHDDVWARAGDWRLELVPALDRRGNVVEGVMVQAACYWPRGVSSEEVPAILSSSD